jgi:hypothetical protein
MIVFDLHCSHGHIFEEWFDSGADVERRLRDAAVTCPECGDARVEKALAAPRVNSGASAPATPCGLPACSAGGCQFSGMD